MGRCLTLWLRGSDWSGVRGKGAGTVHAVDPAGLCEVGRGLGPGKAGQRWAWLEAGQVRAEEGSFTDRVHRLALGAPAAGVARAILGHCRPRVLPDLARLQAPPVLTPVALQRT